MQLDEVESHVFHPQKLFYRLGFPTNLEDNFLKTFKNLKRDKKAPVPIIQKQDETCCADSMRRIVSISLTSIRSI